MDSLSFHLVQIVPVRSSNLTVKAKKLSSDVKKPFLIVQNRSSFSSLWTVINDVRTFFRSKQDFVIPSLPEPMLD